MTYEEPKPEKAGASRYPDTPEADLGQRMRARARRRAKNKMRRATKQKQR